LIVIADASPLNYLVLIGHVDILRQMYAHVVVPTGVVGELRSPSSPPAVRTWATAPPDWIEVQHVDVPPDAGLDTVDEGEAEAEVRHATRRRL
jgi:predicted nucleic acid-binding protein